MNEAYCLVPFKQSYVFSSDCIGRRFSFSFSDVSLSSEKVKCTILFPCKDSVNQFLLKSPIPEISLGVHYDWGKVNYSEPDYVPHVNGVIVILRSEGELVDIKCGEYVNHYANQVLRRLRCNYPYAVDRDSILYPYTKKTIVNSGRGVFAGTIHIHFDTGKSKKWIEFSSVLNAIKHISEEVPLPLQLYDYALDSERALDYRVCVLNCAILIEILMKRDLEKQIDKYVTSEGLKERIIKRANGYSKIIDYMKEYSIAPCIDAKDLFDVRNRIMHGGFSPSAADAQKSLSIAQKYIDYYESVFRQ